MSSLPSPSRRAVLLGVAAASALGACATAPDLGVISSLEIETGSEIGLSAVDLSTGRTLSHRGGQRFAMCSTFKWLLGAAVLKRVEAGEESLSRLIRFSRDDLVYFSPVTEHHVGGDGLSVEFLCETTIATSDNTAANLLLDAIGGPQRFTEDIRAFGDKVTRLDRLEPQLNENAPGDPRDTTTPDAMAALMKSCLFGSALSAASAGKLQGWMIGATTGLDRLRAGIPAGWTAGDKTGTSSNRASNDVAFAIAPPGVRSGPIILASYINHPAPTSPGANALHAKVAHHVFSQLAPPA